MVRAQKTWHGGEELACQTSGGFLSVICYSEVQSSASVVQPAQHISQAGQVIMPCVCAAYQAVVTDLGASSAIK